MRIVPLPIAIAALAIASGQGQLPPASILEIQVENAVRYQEDISDLSRFATNPDVTTAIAPKNFFFRVNIGDIVAINGQPAKGTMTRNNRTVDLSPTPNPGQAIADTVRNSVIADTFEILNLDGTPIGTIVSYGLAAGFPAPGAPLSITQGNFAIVGGTGAFLGARGQWGNAVTAQTITERLASVTEDPANRRRNGGGRLKFVLQVVPMFAPQVAMTASGPAVFHADDFSLVTPAKPAKAGEVLIARATGLGPTRPGVNPGQPFPTASLQEVNSPVAVTVNGQSADLINKLGWPELVDTYRVDFRVPEGTTAGMAAIQLTVAWIAGSTVSIPIQ
jgi:uncharacterized protein (TIGR03437 family)